MQLTTKESELKSRIDEPVQLQYSADSDSFIVYFNVIREIAGEKLNKVFDSGMPLMIPIELISDALQAIYLKALELRAIQLASAAEDFAIKAEPDYKRFYGELLTTELFAVTRQKADENLLINAAYTDFALALTNSIVGNENAIALQAAFDRLLLVLGDTVTEEHRQQLQNAIEANAIPLNLQENTSNETDNKV